MSSQPPSPSEGSLPARPAKDAIEQDLWEFDDDLDLPGEYPVPVSREAESQVPSVAETSGATLAAETSRPAAPVFPRLKLGMPEFVSLAAFTALLIAGAVFFLVIIPRHAPAPSSHLTSDHFPLEGARFTVLNAESYWRAPITSGDGAEIVRRDTKLIPVLRLEIQGGPATLRVLFRNDQGKILGDSVTRRIDSAQTLEIAATAGFEDIGMHAGYRTGLSDPWTVELLEGPPEGGTSSDFKSLGSMILSPSLH